MRFNPNVQKVFMLRLCARFYAWRARRKGYGTHIQRLPGTWLECLVLGGRWSVELTTS